jgi:putative membrane protein
MKNFTLMVFLGLAGFGLAACSSEDTSTRGTNNNATLNTTVSTTNAANSNTAMVVNSNTANANGQMIDSMSNTSASAGDTTSPNGFLTEAAKGGMAEVQLSQVAAGKAQNADVKKFAQKMIEDHTNANAELKQLAGKKTVTLPTELDAEHKTIKDRLSGLSGAEFDKEYVNAMVADHEKSVALFKSQAEKGTDADAKAFAAKTLPKLQMHLDMVKAMQGKMK